MTATTVAQPNVPATVVVPPIVGPVVAPGGKVTNANRAPTAASISLIAATGSTTSFTLQAADPEGSPLLFVFGQLPGHGKLTGQAPNLGYTPDQGFLGLDAFTFTANDGADSSAQTTVTITVTGANGPKKVAKAIKVKIANVKKVKLVCKGKGTRRVCR